jgi:TonB family protein
MATAPRQASLSSVPSNRDYSLPSELEPATVEESLGDVDLVTILREAAASGSRPLESIVDAVADAARVLSGADGTALGLETKGIILCRARSGNIAPPIGAPISAESGISGECLRTITMLVCHDAMTDPRVDAEVCRSLGIRSVAAVPLRGQSRVAGILEAFSARPNAFDGDALTALRDLAEIAETAYGREARNYTPVGRPFPEVHRPNPATRPTAASASEGILDGLSQVNKGRVLRAVAIAVVLLLVVGVAWWAWHTPADEASSSSSSSSNTQNVRAATPEPAHSAPALELIPKPAPGMSSARSERSRVPSIVENAAEVKPIDLRGVSGTPDTIEVRGTKTKSTESPSVPDPPAVNVAASANPEALDRLSSIPAQMPIAPRISQGVVEATLIHRVEPAYPTQARNQRIQGKVTLSATIAVDGSIRQVSIVNGSPVLAEAAKTAVRQWRYNPAKLNGTPIEVQKEIIVVFAQPY